MCPYPIALKKQGVSVSCGKCSICRRNKKNSWAFRLLAEASCHSKNYFVTLTYDNEKIRNLGESFCRNLQLEKSHLQKYLKRVRKKGSRFRYYAVGEYGSKRGRPHYHIIFFGGNESHIRSSWPFGFVHVGYLSPASVAYTLKYISKDKSTNEARTPNFAVMSRKPGLGAVYLKNSRFHLETFQTYVRLENIKIPLPRYYVDKIFVDENLKETLKQKKAAVMRQKEKMKLAELAQFTDLHPMVYEAQQCKNAEQILSKKQNENLNEHF